MLALALAGAGTAAPEPFEINVVLSLTGQNAFLGNQEQQAIQTAESVVNAHGGIRGRPVRFVFFDDQTNPQVAVQLANALIAKNVPAVLGFGIAATCKAAMPLIERNGPVTFCFTPAIDPPPGGYIFSSTVSTFDTISLAIRYFRARGWTRLALVTTSDATGQDVQERVATALALPENRGVQLVANEHFGVSDISAAAQVARIKAAAPQALLISATGTPFGTILHSLHDAGVDVPVWTGNSNMTYEQMTQYAAFLPKTLDFSGQIGMLPGIVPKGAVHDAQTAYFDALAAKGLRPSSGSNLSWDATMLLVDAFRRLGTDATAPQIRAYLERLRGWPGINGAYTFNSATQRGVGQGEMVILQWDAAQRRFVAVSKIGGYVR